MLRHIVIDYLNLFGPVARIAMPTLPVGSLNDTHKSQRTVRSCLSALDELMFITDHRIVYYCCRRQPAAFGPRAASIACPPVADTQIGRP